jgi:hypothetical protein
MRRPPRTVALSRREWMQGVSATGLGLAAGTASLSHTAASDLQENGSILPFTSNTDTLIPAQGRSFMKFSYDFPEPCIAFEGLQFGFHVFTFENVYAMDSGKIEVANKGDALEIRCSKFLWAGGQQTSAGNLRAQLAKKSEGIELTIQAEMPQRIKSLAAIVRGVPKGRISGANAAFFDPGNDEVLLGYPFSAGDLQYARGLTTPLVIIDSGPSKFFFLSARDTKVRATRFYLQPCEHSYRVELITECEGWSKSNRVESPVWRLGHAESVEAASRPHYAHVENTYSIPNWEQRTDVPKWMRSISLVTALHGMHYTGYVFNSFAKMLTIVEWMARQIDPGRVLVFLPAWDGRYYWEYAQYRVSEHLGGEVAFRRLVNRGHELGFRFMPMFGTNAANRNLSSYSAIADAATSKIDGDRMDLNWVDWDNDRHMEGWLSYMNPGVDSWRQWLSERISDVIEQYKVDAYFLDIVGGWTNNPKADMHSGTRKLIEGLRAKYPNVLVVGEMHYDALLAFLPVFQVFTPTAYPPAMQKYARTFHHLSHPAPGRGSTGVHESGFGQWDPQNLSMANPLVIPTLTVVDDTWDRYREQMLAVIEVSKKWNRS